MSIQTISIPQGFNDGVNDTVYSLSVGGAIGSDTITAITSQANPLTGLPIYYIMVDDFNSAIVYGANGAVNIADT